MDRDAEEAQAALGGDGRALSGALVLLDVDLPGLDGLGVLARLAADGVVQRTRVIMLTVGSAQAEVAQARALGAFDYVAKPFNVPAVMQRVRRAIEN